jgi:peptide/nickel transport system substrate-binding protein
MAALALVAGACGSGSKGTPSTATPPKATENQMNPMARDKLQDGGKLTWPIDELPVNFNYNELDGTEASGAAVVSAMMPITYNTDAGGTPIWDRDYLASEPKLTTDPKQVVTYEINPKAMWYDGTPITWEDFYWQWKASNGTDSTYQISSSSGYEDIENVAKGKDDREVVVTFKDKYADWQSLFNLFYPASTNKNPTVFNTGWKDKPLTTAGPFKLSNLDPTAKTVTLVRNEKWWGNPAKLDTIVFRAIELDAQIDALANGEVDFMDVGPDANKYNRAKGLSGIDIRVAGGPNYRHATFNGTSPNLQDVNVRQALAMAIDRNAIAKALLGPLGVQATALNNHIFMANQNGYQDNSGAVGKFNPDKAKQMLDAAGWKLSGNTRQKDGKNLELSFVIPSGVATSKQEAELIQNMLGQVGVKVNINTVPSNDFFDKYVTPGQFDITVFSWLGTAYPISSSKSIYAKPAKNDKGELDIQQNYARVGSDEIDGLFDQANHELDRQKAIDIANHIDSLVWQEVHSLTTYQRPDLVAAKKNLANLGATGFATIIYQDIGWAKA